MIPSITDELTKSIKAAKTSFKALVKKDWQDQREKAMEYLLGRTKAYTKKYMNEQAKEEVPPDNNNVVKRVIDRISLVYSIPPIRAYGSKGKDKPNAKYQKAVKNKDQQLRVCEKHLNLLNLIAIKPTLRNKMFDYDLLQTFEPHFDDDPLTPTGISYPLAVKSNIKNNTPELWVYITKDTWVVYDAKNSQPAEVKYQIYEDMKNPFGILPVVFAFTQKPHTAFLDVDPANDLVQMNEVINVLGTAGNANVIYQSYGYIVATGIMDGQEKKIKVGANRTTYLGRDQDIKIVQPPDTLEGVKEMSKHKIQAVALNYHLPHGFIDEENAAESGEARKVRNRELQDERKGDVINWRTIEEQIYKIETAICKHKKYGLNIGLPQPLAVDYTETEEILTPQEQWDIWEKQLKLGLISLAEIYLKINPDKFGDIKGDAALVKAQDEIDLIADANKMISTQDELANALRKGSKFEDTTKKPKQA